MSKELIEKCKTVFKKFDVDNSNEIDLEETLKFWQGNFSKLNAKELFEQMDVDKNGLIELDEWIGFWNKVKKHGYQEEEISEEVN